MTFTEFVTIHKPQLQEFITSYLNSRKQDSFANTRYYVQTIEKLSALTVSGKMLRGLFIPFIYELLTSKPYPQQIMNASAAMELLQTAMVTHDDIIDNDHQRRGQKTIFSQYIDEASQAGYARTTEYGKNMGICVGDIAIFLGYDLLRQSSDSMEQMQTLHKLFSREMQLVCVGEMIDIDMAESPDSPTQEEILHMYRCKTARYSFSLPFMMGAVLAGATEETTQQLAEMGESMGILFQIKDDELGLTGNTEETGKPVGADIAENKKTIHRTLLLQHASEEDKIKLNALFGKKDIIKEEQEYVVQALSRYGIHEKIMDIASLLETRIVAIEEKLPVTEEGRRMLQEITAFITRRNT